MDACRTASFSRTLLFLFLSIVSLPVPAKSDALKDYEIALTKGQYEIEERSYARAVTYLTQALELKPGDHAALLALGIAYSRSEEYAKAKEPLQKVVAEDPGNARARYELGIVLAHLKEYGEANRLLATVTALTAGEELTDSAKELIDGMETAKKKDKQWLRLGAGAQYDSNVILDPDNPVVPGGKKADWRGILSLLGSYPFLTSERGGMEGTYQFYQSLHASLEDFNVQQHTVSVTGRYGFSSNLQGALRAGYATSYVGGDHYSAEYAITPSLSTTLLPGSRTRFLAGWESRRYMDAARFPRNSDRSGPVGSAGVAHTQMITKDTSASAEYLYQQISAATENWDATVNKGSVTARSGFGALSLFAGVSLGDWKYGQNQLAFLPDRHDRRWDGIIGLYHDITRKVRLNVANQYIVNDSNLDAYAYRRNIAGIVVEIEL